MSTIDSIRPDPIYEPKDYIVQKNPVKKGLEVFRDEMKPFLEEGTIENEALLEHMKKKAIVLAKNIPLPKVPELEAPKKALVGSAKEVVESRSFNMTLPKGENVVHLTDSELEKFVMVFLQFLLDFNLDKTELNHDTILQDKKLMKALHDEMRAAGLKIEETQKVSGVLNGIGVAFSVTSLLAGGLTLLGFIFGIFTGGIGAGVGVALGVLTGLSGIAGAATEAGKFYVDDQTKKHTVDSIIYTHGRNTHQDLVRSGADKFSKTGKERHDIIAKMIEVLTDRQEMLKRTKIS